MLSTRRKLVPSSLPRRIVVRGTNWLGDTVMSVPALKEIRQLFPAAWLAVWVPSDLADFVRATGIPDAVISFDRNSAGPVHRAYAMRATLAAEKFDMAILLQNAFESAFTAWLARIPLRVGYPTDLRGPLLNVKVPLESEIKLQHQVFYYLAITDFLEEVLLGRTGAQDRTPDCSVKIQAEALDRARDLLLAQGMDLGRPIFSLCPGSVNSEAKRWPADHFARLADLLTARMNGQVLFLGARSETSLIDEIRAMMSNKTAVNLADKADMVTAMGAMNLSRLVVSNDTGSAHLAVAAGAKVLTLFGPTSASATAPYGPQTHIMQGWAPCAPCRHFSCPLQDHPCMRGMEPKAVAEKVEEILAGNSQAPLLQPNVRAS